MAKKRKSRGRKRGLGPIIAVAALAAGAGVVAYLYTRQQQGQWRAFSFDFGTDTSPVEPGYTKVTGATIYSPALGYGWDSIVGLWSRDRGALADNLRRDLVQSTYDRTFVVDLPNGHYNVGLIIGDALYLHDLMDVSIQGVVAISQLNTAIGVFNAQTFMVAVTNGRMTFLFHDAGGVDLNWVINAITIAPIVPPTA